MQSSSIFRWPMSVAVTLLLFCAAALYAASDPKPHFLITNNDASQNSASFYKVLQDGSLHLVKVVSTNGAGVFGVGAVATKRASVLDTPAQQCAFVSNAGSANVAAISIPSLTLTGTFSANPNDTAPFGIGVVNNGKYVYASFTGSNTLATYQIQAGCKLKFLQDVPAIGLSSGSPLDMKVHGNILVMSFQDGSIESFNVANGVPVSNGDLQLSTGNTQDGSFPAGVDITADGHYAIFGGTNTPPIIEVSDISSGKLTPTVVYSNIGTGGGSEAIWLSPDETLLYISNFSSNSVTAAFFDKTTGAVSFGCMGTFKGIGFMGGLATATQFGTGGSIYDVEPDTGIGFAQVTNSAGVCSIQENANSPETTAFSSSVESATSFPPRPF